MLRGIQGSLNGVVECQVKLMETGLSVGSIGDEPDQTRRHLAKLQAISGQPSYLAERFNELVLRRRRSSVFGAPKGLLRH